MIVNIIGKRFGRLVIVSERPARDKNKRCFCHCDCGNWKEVRYSDLSSGDTKSCGCLRRETTRATKIKHGMSKGSTEYTAWIDLKYRCLNPNHQKYSSYGGRGITVCERWINSFEAFFDDMGLKPSSKHSIDRKDNNLGYNEQNCVVCCKNCNVIKSDKITYDLMIRIGNVIKEYREEHNL